MRIQVETVGCLLQLFRCEDERHSKRHRKCQVNIQIKRVFEWFFKPSICWRRQDLSNGDHQQTKEYLPWIGELGDCHCGKAVTKRSSCNFKHGFVPPISIEAGDMFFVGLPHYATWSGILTSPIERVVTKKSQKMREGVTMMLCIEGQKSLSRARIRTKSKSQHGRGPREDTVASQKSRFRRDKHR
jgi:hypothetical protein